MSPSRLELSEPTPALEHAFRRYHQLLVNERAISIKDVGDYIVPRSLIQLSSWEGKIGVNDVVDALRTVRTDKPVFVLRLGTLYPEFYLQQDPDYVFLINEPEATIIAALERDISALKHAALERCITTDTKEAHHVHILLSQHGFQPLTTDMGDGISRLVTHPSPRGFCVEEMA